MALHSLIAVGLVLAMQGADSSCEPTLKACGLDFAGLEVRDGRVVDTVTVVCDQRPVRHYLEAWIKYKPFDEWDRYDRTAMTSDIPGSGRDPDRLADRPLRVTVSSPCARGTYRTQVHVEGRGPVNETTPRAIPFEFEDTGWQRYFSADDCAGGG